MVFDISINVRFSITVKSHFSLSVDGFRLYISGFPKWGRLVVGGGAVVVAIWAKWPKTA